MAPSTQGLAASLSAHFVMGTRIESNHTGDAASERLTSDVLFIGDGKVVSHCGCCNCCKGLTLPLSSESDYCHEDAPGNNKRLQEYCMVGNPSSSFQEGQKPGLHSHIYCFGNDLYYTCFFSVVFTPMQVSQLP